MFQERMDSQYRAYISSKIPSASSRSQVHSRIISIQRNDKISVFLKDLRCLGWFALEELRQTLLFDLMDLLHVKPRDQLKKQNQE